MAERILLLHGLMMRSPAMWPLAGRLRRQGFQTLFFGYSTLWSAPARAMERLAMRLYALGPEPVHLVAHSLGGLIALETLRAYQGLPPGRVVCMGAPLAGSVAARGLASRHLGPLIGKSGPLLRAGIPQVPDREVGAIAGSRSMGLGRWFGDFDGINDGTVAVWETRLPGLTDHRVLPVSHSGMVLSPKVAELTASFLRHGHFVDPAR